MPVRRGRYGRVEYADPGYQADGKPRYPLNTREHVTAAARLWQLPSHWRPYTRDEQSQITGRIHAAAGRLGMDLGRARSVVRLRFRDLAVGDRFVFASDRDAGPWKKVSAHVYEKAPNSGGYRLDVGNVNRAVYREGQARRRRRLVHPNRAHSHRRGGKLVRCPRRG